MDILTSLDNGSSYSSSKLQMIIGAWVMSDAFRRRKVSIDNGDVSEDDYTKQSIYSLLYAMYRSIGEVKSETGEPYEFTFNTWGYAWPEGWGAPPTTATDPQRFGKNAYTGLLGFAPVRERVAKAGGKVHVVELGCGTGAGAHHISKYVLPDCTYNAVDMQKAAIETCNRRFVPELGGRLKAIHGDVTKVEIGEGQADIVVICETHITEHAGVVTDEDKRFFDVVRRTLKPGGYLCWGNAIPDATWQPCFDQLASIGMPVREVRDVTAEAILARDQDKARVEAYVEQCLKKFHGFKIPVVGKKKRREAELALKNFYRHPGTNLYDTMVNGTDTYRVVMAEKV
ncbi:MAG: class I SAM-dependent methyltransferase [Deltaproteobacteria bacterium]|nr:class I SAM-dependent methyltransferase [Deltaproteobacteria bacterium]